jgi:hypothetical protein
MDPKAIVQAAIQAWEEKNVNAFASYLADDLICRQMLPQTEGKAQLLSFVNSLTTAFPDWSFNGHILHEEREADQSWSVLFVTAVTGTQTGELILPTLPIIPATGRKIALPNRHMKFFITHGTISAINSDFSPDCLEEVLAQLGLELP